MNLHEVRVDSHQAVEADRVAMEIGCLMEETRPLYQILASRVIGQDDAVNSLVCSYARLLSGLHDPARPLLTALLLDPTGVGKTETAKAIAQTLFGSERGMTRACIRTTIRSESPP